MSKPSTFLMAYAEWHRAKADIAELDAKVAADDGRSKDEMKADAELMNDALDAVRAAEWKMLQTPAQGLPEIRLRASIVLDMFDTEIEAGEPTDNRHRLMLAALVTEIRAPIPQPNGDL